MHVRVFLIRHGITKENSLGIYIGSRTDVPLCEDGKKDVEQKAEIIRTVIGKDPFKLTVSPMIRCRETAGILFPKHEISVQNDLREADFGRFEGKNYEQLNGDEEYQKWIDSNGKLPFPGGEYVEEFIQRSFNAFKCEIAKCEDADTLVVVAHGGTVMSVMSCLTDKDYYAFQVPNVDGYFAQLEIIEDTIKLLSYERIINS